MKVLSKFEKIKLLVNEKNFIVVDKPVGISIHNQEDETHLLEAIQKQHGFKKLLPVHRLDKETSGVQVLALNEKTARSFSKEFQEGNVEKKYIGILRGSLKVASGVWNQSLTDKAEGRKNPAGLNKDRVYCETHYSVLKKNKFFSFCEFDLKTGRQHQIRKHSSMAGHPLVGDSRYGETKYNKKIQQIYNTERMLLHCSKLSILQWEFIAETPNDFLMLMGHES